MKGKGPFLRFFIAIFLTGGLFDTQCDLKGFRSGVAEVLFPSLREKGFVGDVELLYIALKYNLEIKRIPVCLRRTGPSTVQLFPQALKMLWRIFMLRQNWRCGLYDSEELTRISSQAYWKKPLVKKKLSE